MSTKQPNSSLSRLSFTMSHHLFQSSRTKTRSMPCPDSSTTSTTPSWQTQHSSASVLLVQTTAQPLSLFSRLLPSRPSRTNLCCHLTILMSTVDGHILSARRVTGTSTESRQQAAHHRYVTASISWRRKSTQQNIGSSMLGEKICGHPMILRGRRYSVLEMSQLSYDQIMTDAHKMESAGFLWKILTQMDRPVCENHIEVDFLRAGEQYSRVMNAMATPNRG